MAGLGEKMVEVPLEATAQEVKEAILEKFHKLLEAGGFSFHRLPPNSKRLVTIPISSKGYTAAHLKDMVKAGRVYLRPIQRDLSVAALVSVKVCSL